MPSTMNARVTTKYEVAETSTYASPWLNRTPTQYTSSAVTQHMHEIFDATTGGTAKTFDNFATILEATFVNQDSTNYVDVTGTGAAGAFNQRIAAGKHLTLSDVPVGTAVTFTANTATCSIEALIIGT